MSISTLTTRELLKKPQTKAGSNGDSYTVAAEHGEQL